MKIDRKGDIGFMEAMVGAMTVCIVMMVFMAYVAADVTGNQHENANFDWSYIEEVSTADSKIIVSFSSDPQVFLESTGLLGLSIETKPLSGSELEGIAYMFGQKGESQYVERKLFSVSNGSEITPISVVVTLCR